MKLTKVWVNHITTGKDRLGRYYRVRRKPSLEKPDQLPNLHGRTFKDLIQIKSHYPDLECETCEKHLIQAKNRKLYPEQEEHLVLDLNNTKNTEYYCKTCYKKKQIATEL